MSVARKEQAWERFVAWCEARGLNAASAHPWTLAAYARSLEGTMHVDRIARLVRQIGQVHFERSRKRPDRHPTVLRTLESMRRRAEAAKRPPPPPLFRPDDFLSETPPGAGAKPSRKKQDGPKRGLRATPKLVRRRRV